MNKLYITSPENKGISKLLCVGGEDLRFKFENQFLR